MLGVLAAMLMQAAEPSISNPSWVKLPSPEFFQRYYPEEAAAKQIEGRATIECAVTVDGALEACKVVEESPADAGFGDAAVKLSLLFKMKPQTKAGQPVAGGHIRIPIRFKLPEAQPADVPQAAPLQATFELKTEGPKAIKWLEKPGPDIFAITATRYVKGRSGSAILFCIAAPGGQLAGCRIDSESAPNMGYGYAAMAMARFFRMAPQTADGASVSGGSLRIPFHFIAN